ncbi:MAG TPA: aldolase/citrate lyase family protein [Bryobacteraceae bacterium]|jgi:4-hydroxy-2-oxoheptanedioate aldolase|nr:aldolase/citrate lyase family protein [Bryobacteraceae bacterium]
MSKTKAAAYLLAAGLCFAAGFTSLRAQTPKPKRINRAIELLEQGQPVYYAGSHSGTVGTFEQGRKDAQTYADYISYDMEHAPFDVAGLAEYMKGLVAGGPTKSGHRTPAVIVNVPVNGTDEAAVRANAWMFSQVLATGVHGIMLTHADTPGAIRAFIEAVRLPIHKQGLDHGINEGRRGAHGAATASQIWGVTQDEYFDKADAWPLNPEGELLLGVKLEDKYALANAEESLKVPGIGFAEWGPGDMALSLGVRGPGAERDPKMVAARARVFAACKANKIFFLNSMNPNNVIDQLKEGVMVGPANEQTAEIGRKYTKRQMPW